MGRPPATCAHGGKQLCTAVAGLMGHDGVFAGFADGSAIAGRPSLDAGAEEFVVEGSGGSPVAALAVTPGGWLFVGEASGGVLWVGLDGAAA